MLSATGGVSVKFQHTATRRWLRQGENLSRVEMLFQHTATRRWLRFMRSFLMTATLFQHTATRRWLRFKLPDKNFCGYSFNTQPPEGGCPARAALDPFNFQVSTHSHPKVAAFNACSPPTPLAVSTHSHPKVAAFDRRGNGSISWCFNTQPPEGGCYHKLIQLL